MQTQNFTIYPVNSEHHSTLKKQNFKTNPKNPELLNTPQNPELHNSPKEPRILEYTQRIKNFIAHPKETNLKNPELTQEPSYTPGEFRTLQHTQRTQSCVFHPANLELHNIKKKNPKLPNYPVNSQLYNTTPIKKNQNCPYSANSELYSSSSEPRLL